MLLNMTMQLIIYLTEWMTNVFGVYNTCQRSLRRHCTWLLELLKVSPKISGVKSQGHCFLHTPFRSRAAYFAIWAYSVSLISYYNTMKIQSGSNYSWLSLRGIVTILSNFSFLFWLFTMLLECIYFLMIKWILRVNRRVISQIQGPQFFII